MASSCSTSKRERKRMVFTSSRATVKKDGAHEQRAKERTAKSKSAFVQWSLGSPA